MHKGAPTHMILIVSFHADLICCIRIRVVLSVSRTPPTSTLFHARRSIAEDGRLRKQLYSSLIEGSEPELWWRRPTESLRQTWEGGTSGELLRTTISALSHRISQHCLGKAYWYHRHSQSGRYIYKAHRGLEDAFPSSPYFVMSSSLAGQR
jgi:hypothetical protein